MTAVMQASLTDGNFASQHHGRAPCQFDCNEDEAATMTTGTTELSDRITTPLLDSNQIGMFDNSYRSDDINKGLFGVKATENIAKLGSGTVTKTPDDVSYATLLRRLSVDTELPDHTFSLMAESDSPEPPYPNGGYSRRETGLERATSWAKSAIAINDKPSSGVRPGMLRSRTNHNLQHASPPSLDRSRSFHGRIRRAVPVLGLNTKDVDSNKQYYSPRPHPYHFTPTGYDATLDNARRAIGSPNERVLLSPGLFTPGLAGFFDLHTTSMSENEEAVDPTTSLAWRRSPYLQCATESQAQSDSERESTLSPPPSIISLSSPERLGEINSRASPFYPSRRRAKTSAPGPSSPGLNLLRPRLLRGISQPRQGSSYSGSKFSGGSPRSGATTPTEKDAIEELPMDDFMAGMDKWMEKEAICEAHRKERSSESSCEESVPHVGSQAVVWIDGKEVKCDDGLRCLSTTQGYLLSVKLMDQVIATTLYITKDYTLNICGETLNSQEYERAIEYPFMANMDKMTARMDNGLVSVFVPRKDEMMERKKTFCIREGQSRLCRSE